jgi:PKD repeat protein
VRIDEPLRGYAIVDAIGGRFSELAEYYGKSSSELESILRDDSSVWADSSGHLFEVCEFSALPQDVPNSDTNATSAVGASIEDLSGEQTFTLHSRPSSTKIIYLDFDGHQTSGTLWNSLSNRSNISTPAFDIDGNPAEFSQQELQRIRAIWARVSEDFSPFDVDVTTEQPAPDALTKSSSLDPTFGIRVVVGGSSLDWYGPPAGGASYIGSFNWNTDTAAFVFEEQLGNGNEKYTAEAISHEAGHSLGLFHDGQTNGNAYYGGHASWAPIMGISYGKEITQWSKGEYDLANNTEDDLHVIQNNGLAFRPDDHGNAAAGATRLAGAQLTASGVIEQNTDIDFFSFSTGAGAIALTVAVPAGYADLDVAAALVDSTGHVVSTGTPSGLGVSFSLSVPAGTYYLRVQGTGTGDGVTGFTNYASLGQYTVTGTVAAPSSKPPLAKASTTQSSGTTPMVVSFSSVGSSDPDGVITDYQWTFGDGGSSGASNPVYTYVREGSYTATLTVTDNNGLTAKDSVTIVVRAPAAPTPVSGPVVFVRDLSLRLRPIRVQGVAGKVVEVVVTIGDNERGRNARATVVGTWSGSAAPVSGVTDALGRVTFISRSLRPNETLTFTVTRVSSAGFTYDPSRNSTTQGALTVD